MVASTSLKASQSKARLHSVVIAIDSYHHLRHGRSQNQSRESYWRYVSRNWKDWIKYDWSTLALSGRNHIQNVLRLSLQFRKRYSEAYNQYVANHWTTLLGFDLNNCAANFSSWISSSAYSMPWLRQIGSQKYLESFGPSETKGPSQTNFSFPRAAYFEA